MKKVTAVFFSPTGGTKTYVMEIAKRLSEEVSVIDLTVPENRSKEYTFGSDDVVLFGAPVYAGRLPQIEGGIFDWVKGCQTPAIFNVSYGNREFDDALLEEMEICETNGFVGIAAGAWLAPHTFSDRIAAGRPDESDKKAVEEFAGKIREILECGNWTKGDLKVPGNHPYRDTMTMPFCPAGDETCTECKKCAAVCPVQAVSEENPRITDAQKCIACLACVKQCPEHSRKVSGPQFDALRERLEKNLLAVRKEPEIFMAAVCGGK